MRPKIFLSHNSKDKSFVRKLAQDLDTQGINYWLDEAELSVGDSLIERIQDGIDKVNYIAIVLSQNSIQSQWVQKEMSVALALEISGKPVRVLPLILEKVDIPTFLIDKLYLDFTEDGKYQNSLAELVRGVGLVFNERAHLGKDDATSMWNSQDKALRMGLPFLVNPYHRPHQYIGMPADKVAMLVNGEQNRVGSVIVENNDAHMHLQAEGNFICYVEVDIKATAPHYQNNPFDPEPILGCLSINVSELEKVKTQTHAHTYYDHKRKLKILVLCFSDGGPIGVSFGSKYYGM